MAKVKTLRDDLDDMGIKLTDDIILTAERIHAQIIETSVGTTRRKNKDERVFFCIYNAYLENNEKRDPNEIASLCKLEKRSIGRALTYFTFPRTSYRPKDVTTSPIDLLPNYAKSVGIREDALPSLIECCKKWTDAPKVKKLMPQRVAVAVLKYYMDCHGLIVDIKKLSELCFVSVSDIETTYALISAIDNE